MPEYSFTVIEHDPNRPWLVVGQERHTATLDDGVSFFEWAHEHWPAPRWTVELDPWQLGASLLARSRADDAPSASDANLNRMDEDPIPEGDLIVLRDGSSPLIVLVTEVDVGDDGAAVLARGKYRLPEGQTGWVEEPVPMARYRRAYAGEIGWARDNNLLPEP